ncbi:zinc finger protein interacting with ribonucleoprotein K-like [Ptychodera flava]|uniref:zinc finger protein interacting with ribonucleoprotein K-like n=1 Tax=Ptychodera flava TaxID=63121 RepID=UPI003969E361
MESVELMNKDHLLSDVEPCERTNFKFNGGGTRSFKFNNNWGVLSQQECCAIFKGLKHVYKMHELVKPLETLTEKMCQQYQDNTLSMKDASIIVQSVMQHCLITLEYCMSKPEKRDEDPTPHHEGDHIENQTTLHKDSFSLVECHSHNGDDNDGEISNECGEIYMISSYDGAHGLMNYSGAQESECEGLALIHSELRPFQRIECSKTLISNGNFETHTLTNSSIRPHECKECGKTYSHKAVLISIC